MPFIPVNDTIEVEVRMLLDDQKIENTLYFKKSGGWDIASATGIGNDILVWWTTSYAPFVSSSVTLREIYITDLETPTGFTVTIPAPAPAPAGDRSAASLPNNVCICASFRTNARGRSFRGRNYVSGLSEDSVVLNTLDSAVQSDIVDGYEALFTVASDATSSWVVVSRFSGVDGDGHPIPRLSGLTTNIVSVLIVDPIIDSQRRRLPGRGQ